MPELTVSKLGARAGVTPDTIRYYEREALLPAPNRTPSGYRVYGEDAADRIRFIKGAQRLGLRLREVRELLDVLDRGLCPCGHTEGLLRRRVAEIDREIAQLAELKQQIVRVVERLPAVGFDAAGGWPCEAEFIRAGRGGP